MEPEVIDGVVKALQVFSLHVLLDEMTIHI